jgi:hypothetical protein
MRTATAMPRPIILTVRSVVTTNDEKTTIMMAAAAVMIRPVIAWPRLTAALLSRSFSHSSCMRLTRNTS